MKNPDLVKPTCSECGANLSSEDAKAHFHTINTVSEKVWLIMLPPSCPVGSMQAARAFAEALAELEKKASPQNIQLIPFSYTSIPNSSGSAIECMLVLAG